MLKRDLWDTVKTSSRIAIVEWISEIDGLSQVVHDELTCMGHEPICCIYDSEIPDDVDVVFTFGPYGNLLKILQQLAERPPDRRPITAHWNTEGLPDLRLPWWITSPIGALRSWIGRIGNLDSSPNHVLARSLTRAWEHRVLRFRYLGDYHYAYRNGLLDIFADSSEIYAQIHTEHGIPTVVAHWGATPRWYDDLQLERDIDVIWMGTRGSRRRSNALDRVRDDLRSLGIEIYVADNVENPFIFGQERTQFLNRAKVTLNLTRTWYDDNFSRFSMAAPNRSLIVSEPLLPHCPAFEAGTHYVSAPIEDLANTIRHYLVHDEERERIVQNAYDLVTTQLTLQDSLQRIMDAVEHFRAARKNARAR